MATVHAFDVESNGTRPYHGDRVFAYCLGSDENNIKVYRLEDYNTEREFWQPVRDVLRSRSNSLTAWNLKFELSMLSVHGIRVPNWLSLHDGMQMLRFLRNNEDFYSLEHVAKKYGRFDNSFTTSNGVHIPNLDEYVHKEGEKLGGFQFIDREIMQQYQVFDGQRTLLLHKAFIEMLQEDQLLYENYLQDIQLIRLTQEGEERGILLNHRGIFTLQSNLISEVKKTQQEIYNQIGYKFNINSAPQLSKVLYKDLKLPVVRRTEKSAPSTDKFTFEKLEKIVNNPVFNLIVKFRSYSDSLAMIKSYVELADSNCAVHPEFAVNAATTGRYKCKKPNIQNVPSGKEGKVKYPVRTRQCFRPLDGHVWYLVDYSGVDLRTIIDITQEKELIELLNNDQDVHVPGVECSFDKQFTDIETCLTEFLPKKPELYSKYQKESLVGNVDKKYFAICRKAMRSMGKNVNFAIPYGAGVDKISQTLGITIEEGMQVLQRFQKRLPNLTSFSQSRDEQVRKYGYVKPRFGRKIYLPIEDSYSGSAREVQAVTAYILKTGQVKVGKYLKNKWFRQMHMLFSVHDEIVLEVTKDVLHKEREFMEEITEEMINIKHINVKLAVEWSKTETNWAEAEKIN